MLGGRYVNGACGDVGYIAKRPGHGEKIKRVLDDRQDVTEDQMKEENEMKNIKRQNFISAFWSKADLRSVYSRINKYVDLGMQSYEQDLVNKKNRLKVIMLNEACELTEEYTDKAQKSGDIEFELKKKKAEDIVRRTANEQKSFVEKTYEQLFKNNCDELRRRTQRETRKALNEIHQKQMAEKTMLIEARNDEEEMWSNLVKDEDKKQQDRMIQDSITSEKNKKDYYTFLDKQIKWNENIQKNERCVERVEDGFRDEYQQRIQTDFDNRIKEERRKNTEHADMLFQQLQTDTANKAKLKRDECELEKIIINEAKLMADREKAAIVDDRAQLRKELAYFSKSLQQYRDSIAAHERDTDAFVCKEMKKIESGKHKLKQTAAKARNDLLASCVETRKQQISEKQAKVAAQKVAELEDARLIKFKVDQNNALDDCPRYPGQSGCRVDKYLSQQVSKQNVESEKYLNILKRRAELEEEEFLNKLKQRNEKTDKAIESLLSRPLQMATGTAVHPFAERLLSTQ